MVEHSESDLTKSDSIFQTEISTKNVGWIKYRDGKVLITQNQKKQTDFFFTPFPYLEREESECEDNDFSGRTELKFEVELYTPQLEQSVKNYLHKYQTALCGNETSSSVCDVSLLPMNSIRLVQGGSRSNGINQMYTVDETWKPATLLLQSIDFVIYPSNMTICKQLLKVITEKCRLPSFEIQYSLHGQQTVQRQLEVSTEHVTSTNMYNQIRAQFPSAETVVLTGGDYKELLSESTDRITMTLRVEEGFENLQDPMAIDKLLERQLSTRQVRLEKMNDALWENLYWNSEVTRPDRFAKILNKIIRKDSGDTENFIYDRQAARDATKVDLTQHDIAEADTLHRDISGIDTARVDINRADLKHHDIDDFNSLNQQNSRTHLTHHDKQRLGQLDKLFDAHSRSSSSANFRGDNSETKGGFHLFKFFKGDGGHNRASQTASQSSDNRADISNKEHGKLSETDMLNVKETDQNNLDVVNSRKNHLNITRTDKENSAATSINNNHFNQTRTDINNFNQTKIDKDTDKQYTLSHGEVNKFLRALSNDVHLEGDMIKPRPINARLVKIEKLSTNTKLVSYTVLVRMRSNVHSLPLRCKPGDNGGKLKLSLMDRIDRLENVLQNLTNHVEITRMYDEIRNVQDKISVVQNKTEEKIINWTQVIDDTSNKINVKNDNLYTNLTNKMQQEINGAAIKINTKINNVIMNLTDMVNQNIDSTFKKINAKIEDLYINLTDIKNNALTSTFPSTTTKKYSQTEMVSVAKSTYSYNLTAKSLSFTRPNQQKSGFYFMVINVTASVSGNYTFFSNSTVDNYGCLYREPFNPTQLMSNMIACDDDSGPGSNFRLKATLTAFQSVILVATTYTSSKTGSFNIQVDGLGHVTMTEMVPDIKSTYSNSLTTNSSSFTRPHQEEAGFFFMAIQVNVSISGNYTFVGDSAIDNYGCLYRGPFDPIEPMLNMTACDDESGSENNFQLNATIVESHSVILVVTTYKPLQTGSFHVQVHGPAQVTFTDITTTAFGPQSCTSGRPSMLLNLNNPIPLTYTYYSYSYTPTTHRATIMVELRHDPGNFNIDDLSVNSGVQQLLTNGGFETGLLSPWQHGDVRGGGVRSGCGYGSTYCYSDGTSGRTDNIHQTFLTVPGSAVTVSFYLKSSHVSSHITARVCIYPY